MDEDRRASRCCGGQRYSTITKQVQSRNAAGEKGKLFGLCLCRESLLTGTVTGSR